MKIIKSYEVYGEPATKEAFGADRELIGGWRRLKQGDGSLGDLVPRSTRPRRPRSSSVHYKVIGYIRDLRQEHSGPGKEKIKSLLDAYCKQGKNMEDFSDQAMAVG